jgi:cell division protein ZapB
MATLQDLAARIDRLLLEQVAGLTSERDNLRSRLTAARSRIDTLLERLPAGEGDKA